MVSMAALMEAERHPEAVVSWKVAPPGNVPPDVASRELTAICQRDGVVTDSAIVDAARPAEAPLHPIFEWDDTVAAEAYRRQQAGGILRSLVVVYRKRSGDPMPPVRCFVKVQPARGDEPPAGDVATAAVQPHAYVPIRRVMDDEELRRIYVRQAYRDLLSWRRRYESVTRFAQVFEMIDALADELEDGLHDEPPD